MVAGGAQPVGFSQWEGGESSRELYTHREREQKEGNSHVDSARRVDASMSGLLTDILKNSMSGNLIICVFFENWPIFSRPCCCCYDNTHHRFDSEKF